MRTLGGTTASGVVLDSTRPCLLLRLDFATVLRFSSFGTVTFNAVTYSENDLSVSGSNIKMGNDGGAYTSVFRSELKNGIGCKLWLGYGPGPFTIGPELMLDGEISGANIESNNISIQVAKRWARKIPYRYAEPPLLNNIPADGTRIISPAGILTLERK